MTFCRRTLCKWCLPLCLTLLTGCGGNDGPDIAPVSGVITLDGKPLPQAEVYFSPALGRTSVGVTDKQGRYVLDFNSQSKGAIIGPHTVRITESSESSGPEGQQTKKSSVPLKYSENSPLTAEVVSGKNEINFELTTAE